MCGYNVWPTGRADYRPLLPPRIRLPSPHTPGIDPYDGSPPPRLTSGRSLNPMTAPRPPPRLPSQGRH